MIKKDPDLFKSCSKLKDALAQEQARGRRYRKEIEATIQYLEEKDSPTWGDTDCARSLRKFLSPDAGAKGDGQ